MRLPAAVTDAANEIAFLTAAFFVRNAIVLIALLALGLISAT